MICLSFDEVFLICFFVLLLLIGCIYENIQDKKFKYDKYGKVNPEYLEHEIYKIKNNQDLSPNQVIIVISLLFLGYFAIKTIETFL